MSADVRDRAFKLYRAPFRFERGYIWDADNEMVADDHVGDAAEINPDVAPAARVRGWGRIGYLPEAEATQDAVGALFAEALTKLWREHFKRPVASGGASPPLTTKPATSEHRPGCTRDDDHRGLCEQELPAPPLTGSAPALTRPTSLPGQPGRPDSAPTNGTGKRDTGTPAPLCGMPLPLSPLACALPTGHPGNHGANTSSDTGIPPGARVPPERGDVYSKRMTFEWTFTGEVAADGRYVSRSNLGTEVHWTPDDFAGLTFVRRGTPGAGEP